MQCQRCKFENIPGQTTCIKCGSAMQAGPTTINVYPPRMSKLQRPFRGLLRLIRKAMPTTKKSAKQKPYRWLKNILSDSSIGLCLSIIPGLAHLVQNRFKEIRWYFLAWLLLLISGLFLYGSTAGFICIGLAVGLHAGIGLQYGILKDLKGTAEKIFAVIFVFIALGLAYRFVPVMIVPNLTGNYTYLNIPYHDLEPGDYLLAWRELKPDEQLSRGSLVLVHPIDFTSYGRKTSNQKEVTGQIIALPGEKLEIHKNLFVVNDVQLDADRYPVQQWLQNLKFYYTIPDNSYFISIQYNLGGYGGIKLVQDHVIQVCVFKGSDVTGKVFMIWQPLSKRGLIR